MLSSFGCCFYLQLHQSHVCIGRLFEKNERDTRCDDSPYDETAAKVHLLPPCDAQTGPAARNDEEVMRRHLKMLSDDHYSKHL